MKVKLIVHDISTYCASVVPVVPEKNEPPFQEKLIHLIPKWRPINYSFVCMLISPLCLVSMCKTQKNFEVKMRQRGLINMQTKQ